MRPYLIAGNWKMHTTPSSGTALAQAVVKKTAGLPDRVHTAIFPPLTHLTLVAPLLQGSRVALGAQNVWYGPEGAVTGEVSTSMLKGLCAYVVVGHSERRELLGEDDALINEKVKAALDAGLTPVVCVGENRDIRESGQYLDFIRKQVKAALIGVTEDHLQRAGASLVLAYEPIWAIGTGLAATGRQAQEVAKVIREVLAEYLGLETAQQTLILYGGSTTDENLAEFLAAEDVDGALVGGASLSADKFGRMLRIAAEAAGSGG
jgi:triosephosphate isomerase